MLKPKYFINKGFKKVQCSFFKYNGKTQMRKYFNQQNKL